MTQPFELISFSDDYPGAEIIGVDARKINREITEGLKHALAHHGVIVLRQQKLMPAEFVVFGQYFGELERATREQFWLPEQPEIYVISNIVVDGRPIGNADDGISWHTDQYYLRQPTSYTMLYGLETPAEGGDTKFCSTRRSYEQLPDVLREFCEETSVRASHANLYKGRLTQEQIEKFPDVIHPLVRRHPLTGAKSLYFGHDRVATPLGMSEVEGKILLRELHERTIRPEHTYSHKWQPGDLVIWDNCGLMHTGSAYDKVRYRRLVHRISIVGERPV